MIKPPKPPDLKQCPDCGRILGDHKGWFGPQCMCGKIDHEKAANRAHGVGAGTARK